MANYNLGGAQNILEFKVPQSWGGWNVGHRFVTKGTDLKSLLEDLSFLFFKVSYTELNYLNFPWLLSINSSFNQQFVNYRGKASQKLVCINPTRVICPCICRNFINPNRF